MQELYRFLEALLIISIFYYLHEIYRNPFGKHYTVVEHMIIIILLNLIKKINFYKIMQSILFWLVC